MEGEDVFSPLGVVEGHVAFFSNTAPEMSRRDVSLCPGLRWVGWQGLSQPTLDYYPLEVFPLEKAGNFKGI